MKGKHIEFVAGIVVGAVLLGGSTAYAAGLLAEPSTQTFYLGDQQIQLEAYNINGHNYVKLRDVGQAVDFNVCYDPGRNAAIIEPDKPYTGEDVTAVTPTPGAQPGEGTDYAAQANPAIFTEELTREVYNAYRDVVVHQEEILAGTYIPQAIPDRDGLRETMDRATSVMGNYPVYEQLYRTEDDSRIGNVKHPETFDAAKAHTDAFIASLEGMSDREKVIEIDWYICQRMTYSQDIVSPTLILARDDITAGNCMSHAHSFIYLCGRAGIPCLLTSSETHQWNRVYLEGQWWEVDVTGDDMDNTTEEDFHESFTILHPLNSIQGKDFVIRDPELNQFVRELLVPGSTK